MVELASTNYNSKSRRVSLELLEDIQSGRYKAGSLLPAEMELAKVYNISRPTVRRAVEELIGQGHLLKLPQRGVIIPDNSRSESRIAQIAFITPSLTGDTHPYVQGLTAGIDNERFTLATFSSQANLPKYQEMVEKIVRFRPAGMVIISMPEEICRIDGAKIAESGIPCVTIEPHQIPGLSCDRVASSAYENGRQAALQAVEQGYRDIAVLTQPPAHMNQPMLQGIRSVLEPANIKLPEERVVYYNAPHGYMNPPDPYIDAENEILRWLDQGFRPEAIIAGNDYPAAGAVRAFIKAGLRIPQDIKIISAMKCAVDSFSPMQITTVDVNRHEQGRVAGELLMRRINRYAGPPEVHYVSNRLIEGETG